MPLEELFDELPSNWDYITLGEACSRGGGGIQTGPFGSQLHAADYVADGIPSIMPLNIGENRVVEDGIARITAKDAARLNRYLVQRGDIVYSRRGDVERRALIREHEDGWLCGTGCLRVRLGEKGVNPTYTSYYLGHPAVREWIVRHAQGATMPNLNTSILSALPFVFPPPDEQRAIASILGALDDKIELNRRMNETLEEMARTLFKSWFVPAYRSLGAGKDATQSALPKGWREGSILEVAKLLSGGTPKTERKDYWNGNILWASAKDVSQCGQTFLVTTERTITEKGLRESATQLIPAHSTVVVARGATTGRMTMFGREIAMNQTCYALTSKTGTPFALYCLFRHAIDDLVQTAHGSVFDTITTTTFASSKVVLPPPQELAKFEKTVSPIFARILSNIEESRTLVALRDALLPKLLSGELRVPLQTISGGLE